MFLGGIEAVRRARDVDLGLRAGVDRHLTGEALERAGQVAALERLRSQVHHRPPRLFEAVPQHLAGDIELRFGPDGTNLIVSDNGQGLESAGRATAGAHFGLQGVRERVDKLGGLLDIDSKPGEGTRLAVLVPARAAGVPARAGGLW